MDFTDLGLTALRAAVMYAFVLFIVRLLGKREVGNVSAIDLIVALMIGEMTDEPIFGDVSLLKGFLAIGMIAVWHLANSWLSYKSRLVERLTEAEPTVLVEHGQIRRDALAEQRMSEGDLFAEIRIQGIDDLSVVKRATLEKNGKVSVIKEDWAEPIEKGDLARLKHETA